VRFASIWSNPPIRIGKAALHDLLLVWLGRLVEGGFAVLVVSKHLGSDSLAAWLADEGWAVERLGSRQGYRLLRVTAARPEGGEPA
jgi:16S rRNA (guanine1207-N2)-methyltransferase